MRTNFVGYMIRQNLNSLEKKMRVVLQYLADIRTDRQTDSASELPYHGRVHVFFEVGAAESAVPVVGDVASVHDLAEQVAQVLPRHLGVGLEVVVEDVDADGEVADVERVAAVPALRTELAPLADDRVEVAQREEDALELGLARTHLQRVLSTTTATANEPNW